MKLTSDIAVINVPGDTTEDGFDFQTQVNYLAPFLLTNLLLERMIESAPARIINVSAMFHLLGHCNEQCINEWQCVSKSSGMKSFCNSKHALVEFTCELAQRLEGTGVTANVVDPILSQTEGYK